MAEAADRDWVDELKSIGFESRAWAKNLLHDSTVFIFCESPENQFCEMNLSLKKLNRPGLDQA